MRRLREIFLSSSLGNRRLSVSMYSMSGMREYIFFGLVMARGYEIRTKAEDVGYGRGDVLYPGGFGGRIGKLRLV